MFLKQRYYAALTVIALGIQVGFGATAHALTPEILFPVLGGGWYMNDFAAYRTLNGVHGATDIFAKKHTPLVACADGYVSYVAYPQPSYGWYIQLTDDLGYQYNYIHINNDTIGTDDGLGGPMLAYAPDMKVENRVTKGQIIGYVGDSGNAENTPPHLHFEIYGPTDNLINPYEHLVAAPIKYDVGNPSEYPVQESEFLPYGMYKLGVSVAMGNVDNDPEQEIITGAGAPGGPHVKVFEQDKTFSGLNFFAYSPEFTGGVDVAAGDVDGDGIDEIITGAGAGGGPHVEAFKADGKRIASFFAYDSQFSGGVNVAAGDVDGDGIDEIITGAGAGGGPHVRIFKPNGTVVADLRAYVGTFSGGVDVAAGDLTGDAKDEIVTAAGPGAGPHVRVLSYTGINDAPFAPIADFAAYNGETYHGGVRVSVGDVYQLETHPKSEIITAPASSGGPHGRMFNYVGAPIMDSIFLEEWWTGGYDIAAGDGVGMVGVGTNRRASIRAAFPVTPPPTDTPVETL